MQEQQQQQQQQLQRKQRREMWSLRQSHATRGASGPTTPCQRVPGAFYPLAGPCRLRARAPDDEQRRLVPAASVISTAAPSLSRVIALLLFLLRAVCYAPSETHAHARVERSRALTTYARMHEG